MAGYIAQLPVCQLQTQCVYLTGSYYARLVALAGCQVFCMSIQLSITMAQLDVVAGMYHYPSPDGLPHLVLLQTLMLPQQFLHIYIGVALPLMADCCSPI